MVPTFLEVHTRPRLAYALRSRQRILNQVPNNIISHGTSSSTLPPPFLLTASSDTLAFSLRLMPSQLAIGAPFQLAQAPPPLHLRPLHQDKRYIYIKVREIEDHDIKYKFIIICDYLKDKSICGTAV